MSRGFLFKTILIYEALAILGWNVMARTEADYEKWLFENIHAVVYITPVSYTHLTLPTSDLV